MFNDNFQKGFLEIPHTSDAAILVYGSSVPDLFVNAAYGMYHIMGIVCEDSPIETDRIQLEASDTEEQLVRYLTELLYLAELKVIAFPDEVQINGVHLISTITKKPLQQLTVEIKAVTFSELNIIHNENMFQTKIVFDL